jgi:hypothetical protein
MRGQPAYELLPLAVSGLGQPLVRERVLAVALLAAVIEGGLVAAELSG